MTASTLDRPATALAGEQRERRVAAIGLFVALAIGVVVRRLLWPTPGLVGDLDQFVVWAHGVATQPLGHAYDQDISFPPVMVYLWALLAAIDPALRTATSSADESIRAIMKAPATFADLALAGVVAWHLRATPRWAALGGALIVLHPAVLDTSAWWGQYESIYVLFGAIAFVLAVRGHSLAAAAALAIALMTKPQAVPFSVPFAAWFLARDGWRGALQAGAVAAVVIAVLWLPFIAAGGIGNYLGNVAAYQGGVYSILSLRAWNPWWLVQQLLAGGSFVSDQGAMLGPLTLRHVGYGLAALGEVAVFVLVYRRPTPRALAFGLAASVLVAFELLTSMHERYAFGAIAFLALALPDRRALALSLVFGAAFTLNLLAAAPPTPAIGAALPIDGLLGVAGSIAMIAVLGVLIAILREPARAAATPPWAAGA